MTIAGIHTVHELRNLWDAYSFELQAMNTALADAWATWSAADPQGFATWNADYAKVSAAVASLGGTVDSLIAGAAGSEDTKTAIDPTQPLTDQFNVLLAAFASGNPAGPTTQQPGGFNDLDARFRAGPAASFAPTYVGIPKPDAPDLDLQAYQLSDTALKVVQKILSTGTNWLLWLAGAAVLGYVIANRK